jgi:hypothetical protein
MNEKTTEKVSTTLTPKDKDKLRRVAYADRRKVADFVRNLILEAIEERERKAAGDHERA